MLRITGYSDRYSIRPGDDITFYVNSEKGEDYEAKLVRLIHGDTNPDGPGYKEEEIDAPFDGTHSGRNQKIHGGSYVIVPHDDRMSVSSFTIQAFIFPTTPTKGRQGILTKWVGRHRLRPLRRRRGLPRALHRRRQERAHGLQRQAAAAQGLVPRRRLLRRRERRGLPLPGAGGDLRQRRPRHGAAAPGR